MAAKWNHSNSTDLEFMGDHDVVKAPGGNVFAGEANLGGAPRAVYQTENQDPIALLAAREPS